jgi:hypothetical protein
VPFLSFPKHFDVRFAEHTRNLLNAVLHNLDAARRVWQDMVDGIIESNSKEKQMAKGFIEKWYKGSRQVEYSVRSECQHTQLGSNL